MRGNGKFIYQKWIMNIGSVTDRERDRQIDISVD